MGLNSLSKKLTNTLDKEGVKPAFVKFGRRIRYLTLRMLYSHRNYRKEWNQLKNQYKGERVFLLGNGPSLNKTPLYYLRDEYTMCFNRFYLMSERLNWAPYFFLTVDDLVLDDLLNEMSSILPKVNYAFFPDIHFRGKTYYDKIGEFENVYWIIQKYGSGFSTQLPRVYLGGSVIYEGLQILNHLGFDEIYLIGVDMNYETQESTKTISDNLTEVESMESNDSNHFDPRYFGKGKKFHQPKSYVIKNIISNLRYLSESIDRYNINIINAGYDSKLKCFPKKDFESLFKFSNDHKKKLINECFKNNTSVSSITEFKSKSKYFSNRNNISENGKNFYVPKEEGLKILSSYIFTHIPIGPYEGCYYFVKR